MDTQDRFPPRDTEVDAADRDLGVNRDAEFNPDAVVDDPHGPALPDAYDDGEVIAAPLLQPWQVIGLIAGGLALAVGVGVAGVAYWRLTEAQRPQRLLDRRAPSRFDLAKAQPRRLSQIAARRIEQLPVRDVQKRIARRVSHLFD